MTESGLLRSYGVVGTLASPLSRLWLKKRAKQGKEDPNRIGERHGKTDIERPDGTLIWMHGASVGETMMLLPILNRFLKLYPNAHVLITSQTVTAAQMLENLLPERAIHQFAPLDYRGAVRRFLKHWEPDLVVFGESEIWPNFIRESKALNIPMALINARMSARSLEGWNKHQKLAQQLFGSFDLILAADTNTADGLSWLIDQNIESSGNLKDAAPPLPVDEDDLRAHKAATKSRRIWCAASTHPGEDELIIKAHKGILEAYPKALLILSPRHTDRINVIRGLLDEAGLSYVTRSSGMLPTPSTQVMLIDTMGDMGLAFRLSQISFVCGSLLKDLAGHNPLEPARLDNAVLTGAYISSFADTYMSMIAHDAAMRVLSPDMIAPTIIELYGDKEELKMRQKQAKQYATGRDAVLDYVWEQLSPLMPIMGTINS